MGASKATAVAAAISTESATVSGESPFLSPPVSRVGFVDPDSVDLAGHRGVGAPAGGSVLGGRSVAER